MTTDVLSHSAADVVSRILIALGLGTDPAADGLWPIGVNSEPSTPDNAVTLYDTDGKMDGRRMTDGRQVVHPGIQVMVRGATHQVAQAKAKALAGALDTGVYHATPTLDGSTYCVQSVSRTSPVTCIGKEAPTSQRWLFTTNAVVAIKQTS